MRGEFKAIAKGAFPDKIPFAIVCRKLRRTKRGKGWNAVKKMMIVLMVLALVFSLAACEKRAARTDEEAPQEGEREESGQEEAADLREESAEDIPDREEKDESESEEEPDPDTVKAEVESVFSALKSGDREAIQKRLDYTNLMQLEHLGQSDDNALAILTRMQYSVTDAEVGKDVATVVVEVSNIDAGQLLAGYLKEARDMQYNNALAEQPLTEEEMEGKYVELFRQLIDSSPASRGRTIEVKMLKSGDSWQPQVNDDFRDAVLGGYADAVKEMGQNAGGGVG